MDLRPAGERIDEILGEIPGLPPLTVETARVLTRVVGDYNSVDWAGTRSPGIVASACIYCADYAVRPDDHIGQEELAEVAPGSHVRIREIFQDVPGVFFEHARNRDLEELDPAVEMRLRVFRDAQSAGMKIHKIDPWSVTATN